MEEKKEENEIFEWKRKNKFNKKKIKTLEKLQFLLDDSYFKNKQSALLE